MATSRKRKRLLDTYRFAGFSPRDNIYGIFGDPLARFIPLVRRSKTVCQDFGRVHSGWYDRTTRRARDLSSVGTRIDLEFEVRRLRCACTGKVRREPLDFLADNPLYTKRFAWFVGRRCRLSIIKDVAKELNLRRGAVKEFDKQYMRAQLARAGTPGPKAIGFDEISVRKGHSYRIVVSDLIRGRPIRFGGKHRSEARMKAFYDWLGPRKAKGIGLAVMDMRKPFRNATQQHARQAPSCLTSTMWCSISTWRSTRSGRANTPGSTARSGTTSRGRTTCS